ncbi:MAG: dockerin type I domain-containing protein [Planctomycetota bacterium]
MSIKGIRPIGFVGTVVCLVAGGYSAAEAQVVANGQTLPMISNGPNVATGGQFVIGDDLWGEVLIGSGGSLRTAGITLGNQASGHGGLELRGTSALTDSLDDLVVGGAGEGELRVLDHGRLTTGPASDLVIAAQPGGQGRFIVDGYATADLGGHGYINAWQPESPGRPAVSLDQGATLRFALGNGAGVAAGEVGSLALGYDGTHSATLTAAGDGTLLDVPGVWSLGHAAPGEAELFDRARAAIGTLHLGVASPASLRLDDANLSAHALWAGTASHARATWSSDEHSTIQLGAGGLRFGPIPGVTPVSEPPAVADFTVRGTLTSLGSIDLGGTVSSQGHQFRLLGHDATLATPHELRLGGPTPDERATLHLAGSSAAARSASVEPGGTLSGHGTLTLDRQLNAAGTVHASGLLNVEASRLSRFFADATLAVDIAVVPFDDDADPHTPPIPVIAHGTLAFTDDARLDGTLEVRAQTGFPNLPLADMPRYDPFVLAQTDGRFTGWFQRIEAPLIPEFPQPTKDAIAVVQTDNALIAQRALLGDANLDRRVDQTDLNVVLSNWGASTFDRLVDWSVGDFNGDGQVEQTDLNAVLRHWGLASAPVLDAAASALPEPAIGGLLLAFLGMIRCRNRLSRTS